MSNMTRPCPVCDGDGSIQCEGRYASHDEIYPLRWTEPCEACNGTGSLETDAPQEPMRFPYPYLLGDDLQHE